MYWTCNVCRHDFNRYLDECCNRCGCPQGTYACIPAYIGFNEASIDKVEIDQDNKGE